MNVINFVVNKDKIALGSPKVLLDDSKIVVAKFKFSKEWDGLVKVAKFTRGYTEFEPRVLQQGVECIIPTDALNGSFFRISVLGRSKTKNIITNKTIVDLQE